jgi:type IV fimbrial biogenesis protein FimT
MPSRVAGTSAGFTIIELLVAVAVVAILSIAALPSFFSAVERNRIVSQNNELLASFSYARTEAIRRNATVGVCALNATGNGCATDNWNRGWAVWTDTNRNGAFNLGTDEVLRINALKTNDQIGGTVFDIRFGARGTRILPIATAGATTLNLQPSGCASTVSNRRTLTIAITGSTRSSEEYCI